MPNCTNCNQSYNIPVLYAQAIYPTSCTSTPCTSDCGDNCGSDIRCIKWDGPNLVCSGITTGINLEEAITLIDNKLCAVTGDYSSYDTSCLDNTTAITNEQEFVESISTYVCALRNDFDLFTGTTFTAYQTTVNDRFVDIEQPGLVCPSAGITSDNDLSLVYSKYCAKFEQIDSALSLGGVNWDLCFTVDPNPTTISQGFTAVLQQICSLKTDIGSGGALPTFNNTGSCLPAPLTSTDSLVDTINKIKTRLCQSPTFDINALTWGCTIKPSTTATNLQAAIQTILDKVNDYIQNKLTFSGDFSVTPVDGGNPCQGKNVALAIPSTQDRLLAINSSDSAPGTWVDKVVAGTGVTFDYVTTPGSVIVNANTGIGTDQYVKTRGADPISGYLEDKIKGSTSNGITVTKTTDIADEKVQIGTSINWPNFITALFDAIEDSPSLKDMFCAMVQSCLPDCITPPNVTVVYNTGSTTTSTSTTTTTT